MRVLFPLVAAALFCSVAVCRAADAPKPEIKSASVLGLPAGKTTTVVLYGENLAPKSAKVKPPLAVKLIASAATDDKMKSKGARQVTTEVTVPANCPKDNFELTLTQPDGTVVKTELCVVDSVAMEVPLKKPASTYPTAMPLPGPSVAIIGQLDGDTADLVRLDAQAGELWDISLLSSRAGSPMDPILRIRDSRHLSLALSAGDKRKDRHILFHVPADGTYYIELTEAEARGGPGYNYRMTILRK